MRGAFVGTVGAVAISLAAIGLVVGALRAGPIDAPLEPVVVEATASGTYEARPDTSVLGLCPMPPCQAHTSLDLRLRGLPPAPYEAHLEGATRVPVGPLAAEDGDLVLRWSDERDHGDKDRVTLTLAGRIVAALPLAAGDGPVDVGGPLPASWGAERSRVHLNEIGAITVSTVATARLSEPAPAGWAFAARLKGASGWIELGPFENEADGACLDARVERVKLEEQDRLVVALVPLVPAEGEGPGFPVLQATL